MQACFNSNASSRTRHGWTVPYHPFAGRTSSRARSGGSARRPTISSSQQDTPDSHLAWPDRTGTHGPGLVFGRLRHVCRHFEEALKQASNRLKTRMARPLVETHRTDGERSFTSISYSSPLSIFSLSLGENSEAAFKLKTRMVCRWLERIEHTENGHSGLFPPSLFWSRPA